MNRLERGLEAVVAVAAVASVPIIVLQEREVVHPLLTAADWFLWLVFLTEYGILAAIAPSRAVFVRKHLFNLAIVVFTFPALPELLAFARLARLARLVRIALLTIRGMRALSAALGNPSLVSMAGLTAVAIAAGGASLAILEPETVSGGDIGEGIWWGLVTATTVGYGDVVPKTIEGRAIAAVVMVTGAGLVSTLAAALSAHFVTQERNADMEEIKERLARIEELVGGRNERALTAQETDAVASDQSLS